MTATPPADWGGYRGKEESELPLRSHGSLTLNRALMAPGSSTGSS